MWTVVYMAQNKDIAVKLEQCLNDQGILVKQCPVSRKKDSDNSYFEILVPESEVEEAHSVIIEKGF